MKGTGCNVNIFIAGYICGLIIPAYFLRLMADARKLEQKVLKK